VLATPRAISHDKVRGTGFRINRMESLVVDCSDRDRIDTISIPVKVALVAVCGAVPTSKHKNRSLPIAAVLDAVQYRALDKIARGLHGLSIVRRAP
jgi:hypothetical protein